MEPGIYTEISNSDYHSGPGISKSGLDLIHRSPMHYAAARAAMNDNSTPAQALGTALHALVLEPDTFARDYALPFEPPADALRTIEEIKTALGAASVPFKASAKKPDLEALVREHLPGAVLLSDARAAYDALHGGKLELSLEDWGRVHAMRDAIMADPAARALVTMPGRAEQSAYWIDPMTGELCRCRPDYWTDSGIMVDLKSTRDAGKEAFARSIHTYRYHVQDAFYRDGGEALGRPVRGFVFIAVESDAPHAVGVYQLDPESQELGRVEYRADLARYAEAKRTGQWPGYGGRIQSISLPRWAFARDAG